MIEDEILLNYLRLTKQFLMKQKSWFYVLLIIACFNMNSCTKQDVQILPPVTQTGAGTFACVYNGESLVLNKGNEAGAVLLIDSIKNSQRLQIIAYNCSTNKDPKEIYISIISNFTNGNSYVYFPLNNAIEILASVGTHDTDCFYGTDNTHKGILELTNFDTEKGIVSGRFSFDAIAIPYIHQGFDTTSYSPAIKKIIKIGSGRFDLKMKVWNL